MNHYWQHSLTLIPRYDCDILSLMSYYSFATLLVVGPLMLYLLLWAMMMMMMVMVMAWYKMGRRADHYWGRG
jgi:hypothetical protein